MKEIFESAVIELIILQDDDIICTSKEIELPEQPLGGDRVFHRGNIPQNKIVNRVNLF